MARVASKAIKQAERKNKSLMARMKYFGEDLYYEMRIRALEWLNWFATSIVRLYMLVMNKTPQQLMLDRM